jgi:CRP/FNR family cyclic AMP-dependent transcriptional regulator
MNAKELIFEPVSPSPQRAKQSAPRLTEELQILADLGIERAYRKNAIILNEGEMGDAMYILLQGRVRVFGASTSGKEITFGEIVQGEYFGEMSLDGGTRSASVEALAPCLCAVVPNAQVLAFVKERSSFAVELLNKTISRARKATAAASAMALLDVYERLVQALHLQAHSETQTSANDTLVFPIKLQLITHTEIAARIGASREMVSKLMKDLVSGGYLGVDKERYITLLKKLPQHW